MRRCTCLASSPSASSESYCNCSASLSGCPTRAAVGVTCGGSQDAISSRRGRAGSRAGSHAGSRAGSRAGLHAISHAGVTCTCSAAIFSSSEASALLATLSTSSTPAVTWGVT
eukprot:5962976-Prymnesium_polylepis.1